MIIKTQSEMIRDACWRFNHNNSKENLDNIYKLFVKKAHQTVFEKGLGSKQSNINEYINKGWSVYYFALWNAGRSIQKTFKEKYEPKLDF